MATSVQTTMMLDLCVWDSGQDSFEEDAAGTNYVFLALSPSTLSNSAPSLQGACWTGLQYADSNSRVWLHKESCPWENCHRESTRSCYRSSMKRTPCDVIVSQCQKKMKHRKGNVRKADSPMSCTMTYSYFFSFRWEMWEGSYWTIIFLLSWTNCQLQLLLSELLKAQSFVVSDHNQNVAPERTITLPHLLPAYPLLLAFPAN